MVTLSPRYDLREEAQGLWSVIDHWVNDHYDPEGSVIETDLTEEQARERWDKLIDDDMPRVRAQLERIYRQNDMVSEVK